MSIPSPPDKDGQLKKLMTRLRVETSSSDGQIVADLFDDAIQMCLDYTQSKLTDAILIQAKRLAIVMYNQQGDEGESSRAEGGVSQTFETGIPANIQASLARYRVAKTRRFS